MGMFDDVDVTHTCPHCQHEVTGFQTKTAYNACYKLKATDPQVLGYHASCGGCGEWLTYRRTGEFVRR